MTDPLRDHAHRQPGVATYAEMLGGDPLRPWVPLRRAEDRTDPATRPAEIHAERRTDPEPRTSTPHISAAITAARSPRLRALHWAYRHRR